MAQPTAQHAPPPPPQRPTPGMGTQGTQPPLQGMAARTAPAERTLDPVLAEGVDPVLLHRLYPEADSIEDAASKALEQGKRTMAEGEKLEAAQQAAPEPVR